MLVLVCLLGFAGGGPWVILIGTVGLCIGPFYNQWETLKGRSSVPFDRKIALFFLGAAGNAIFASGLAYFAGVAGRAMMG